MNAHQKFLEQPYERNEVDHELLQARIADEAEIRLREWERIEGASRDAHDYELLLNDLDFIISYAAKKLAEEDMVQAMTQLGFYVASKVQRAAVEVATDFCTRDM